jgi:hypothetical protein
MSQFCGSGLRSRSNVTSAALAIVAHPMSAHPAKRPADIVD